MSLRGNGYVLAPPALWDGECWEAMYVGLKTRRRVVCGSEGVFLWLGGSTFAP